MRARALAGTLGLAAAAALLGAAPAGAQQRTIGADLNRPASATYGCETLPTISAFGGRAFLPSRVATCTYLATTRLGGSTEVPQAPGPSVAIRARVKAGPVVGPMQVTVLRATRSSAGFACCFHAGESAVFTPAPNAVTTVPLRLPMRSDLDPAFGETVDYLGLTVLAPGVPVPAHEIGNPGDLANPGVLAFFPHVRPGDTRADGSGLGGIVPLLQADVIGLCGAARAARVAQAGACLPGLQALGRVRVRGGSLALELRCNVGVPCAGTVRLQSARGGGRTLASARVSLAPGASVRLAPRLTARGRAALRGRATLRAWLNASLVLLGRRTVLAERVTVRR
ncbi:MAG: hypothetical protein MUC84_11595 [Solirubrobacteraceae bacterium]|nr:hypothetical protein [Solirubrobacteraceae bacterium]